LCSVCALCVLSCNNTTCHTEASKDCGLVAPARYIQYYVLYASHTPMCVTCHVPHVYVSNVLVSHAYVCHVPVSHAYVCHVPVSHAYVCHLPVSHAACACHFSTGCKLLLAGTAQVTCVHQHTIYKILTVVSRSHATLGHQSRSHATLGHQSRSHATLGHQSRIRVTLGHMLHCYTMQSQPLSRAAVES
jgi:hypothetical protein